ncbi:bifunctional precorrin-2 dehydrogenase/sirohydrochlorin ferrochelatase [Providencia stuartii]|uniref:precorrin-2 dehydrogenase n=1 Tax=Providencia stuartii TaxID=588 RepID=A0AAJ1JEQ4_PROST|nr:MULTISPECIES: bifunctional precorrin-2 dehydrogenase/sirohydrochlorin ferrochelatase [Providencia]EMA3640646.1 bifunctional precorrin-2 dehydrogenase/sirohydrochlorin ferrochelatase [Providencia stuartii]MBW3103472.1 bifunctional precorrin-2 dehydrogenase/sirohydrochlorin ferrochelatase [Providencia stuartii]MCB5215714.1 bifunctional precorrin-2 dehydrogenase/sirohydrochlorin ferrochelatase [Providencia stuartii]MDE8749480.1 bifunctional precorrin-2 dehydrogenase/sirohydrochlorin ferrochelat
MLRYPLFCDLQGKACLVVGGGQVAVHKCRTLLQARANVTVIAGYFHEAFATLAENPHLTLIEAAFDVSLWPQECWLVFAATDSQEVNQQVLAQANARHCFCNVINAPEIASFITPATIDVPPIQIALTCGGNPVYTQILKKSVMEVIPADAAAKLQVAARLREQIKGINASRDAKRLFWQRFFTDSKLEQLLLKEDDELLTGYLNYLLAQFTSPYGTHK